MTADADLFELSLSFCLGFRCEDLTSGALPLAPLQGEGCCISVASLVSTD